MSTSPKTGLKIVFGAMTFGKPNSLAARVHSVDQAGKIIDIFQKHGHDEIDTARAYGAGSSEEILAGIDWQKRGIAVGTKLYPNKGLALPFEMELYNHEAGDVRRGLLDSLKALKCEKIDMFYLHKPDRKILFEETLREVNNLYKEGRFNRFGISNYMAWEVAQVCEICEENGWIKPSVYQGVYHALQRSIEPELLPCIRHYGIALYAFQPLAGGLLTGRYSRQQKDFEPGSRFDPQVMHGSIHRDIYWNESFFDALDAIRPAAERHGLSVAEVSLRWLQYHSFMKNEHGDAIIVGASSEKHLEENLTDLEKGPLPDEVVLEIEKAWAKVQAVAVKYWL